jgi:hypothetical protein
VVRKYLKALKVEPEDFLDESVTVRPPLPLSRARSHP